MTEPLVTPAARQLASEALVRDLARWLKAIRNAKNLHEAELHAEQALSRIPKELLP